MVRSLELQRYINSRGDSARPADLAEQRTNYEDSALPYPDDLRIVCFMANGVPAEWALTRGCDESRRILYLHGGGLLPASARYSRRANYLSPASGCAVLTVDDRFAPEYMYPIQLEDAIAGHTRILENGPSGPSQPPADFVAGDSAGGCPALSLVHALPERDVPLNFTPRTSPRTFRLRSTARFGARCCYRARSGASRRVGACPLASLPPRANFSRPGTLCGGSSWRPF